MFKDLLPLWVWLPIVMAYFCFFYHYERNGNPVNLGDFLCRVAWSFAFGSGAMIFSGSLTIGVICIVTGFIEILVPHAFAQNMGTFGRPWTLGPGNTPLPWTKYWPGIWLPHDYTLTEWNNLSLGYKRALDFLGMLSVGLVRAVIVFGPLVVTERLWGWGLLWQNALAGGLVVFIGQATDYLIGHFINVKALGNDPDSAEWGEFLVGPTWAVSLCVAFGGVGMWVLAHV